MLRNQREREIKRRLPELDCVAGEVLIPEADVIYLLDTVGRLRGLLKRASGYRLSRQAHDEIEAELEGCTRDPK